MVLVQLFPGRNIGFPSDDIFKDRFQSLISSGRRVFEAVMLSCVDAEDFQATDFSCAIISSVFSWLAMEGVDDVCLVCNPKHASFWVDRVGCEIVGNNKICRHVKGYPGVLVRLDLDAWRNGRLVVPNAAKRVLPPVVTLNDVCTPRFNLSPLDIQFLLDSKPDLFLKTPVHLRRQLVERSSGNSMSQALAA